MDRSGPVGGSALALWFVLMVDFRLADSVQFHDPGRRHPQRHLSVDRLALRTDLSVTQFGTVVTFCSINVTLTTDGSACGRHPLDHPPWS
jgi:hypothetical protein